MNILTIILLGTVIGVIQDIVKGSPFDHVRPCYIGMLGDGNNHLTVRLAGADNLAETVTKVHDVFKNWTRLIPQSRGLWATVGNTTTGTSTS